MRRAHRTVDHGVAAISLPAPNVWLAVRAAAASLLVACALALHGCAAIPIAAVAGAVLEAGGGAIVKTGTEYTASGKVRRTFSNSADEVHAALLEAFRRTDITLRKDARAKDGYRITAEAEHRAISVKVIRLSRALTTLELNVKRNVFASDKATVSELLSQTETVLDERALPAYAAAAYRADDPLGLDTQPTPKPSPSDHDRRSRSRARH